METFFNIRYEFDPQAVHGEIWQAVSQGKTGYICVADANILSLVHRNADYRRLTKPCYPSATALGFQSSCAVFTASAVPITVGRKSSGIW